jgi:hypothetical protein
MSAKQELLNGLNEDLNLELEAVLRYLYHSATATGLLGHELRELLKEDLVGEPNHAVFLADKIVALGGELRIQPAMPKKCKNAKEMLEAGRLHRVSRSARRPRALARLLSRRGTRLRGSSGRVIWFPMISPGLPTNPFKFPHACDPDPRVAVMPRAKMTAFQFLFLGGHT